MKKFKQFLMENNDGSDSTDSSSKLPYRMKKTQKAIKAAFERIRELQKHPNLSETHFNDLEVHHRDLQKLHKEVDYVESHSEADELDVPIVKIFDSIEKIEDSLNRGQKNSSKDELEESAGMNDERTDIRNRIEGLVDHGTRRAVQMIGHPRSTDSHVKHLNRHYDRLIDVLHQARSPDASMEDLDGMHQTAYDTVMNIEDVGSDLQ